VDIREIAGVDRSGHPDVLELQRGELCLAQVPGGLQ
jgi:hypothetical protein